LNGGVFQGGRAQGQDVTRISFLWFRL
jgi:hypothetical protein